MRLTIHELQAIELSQANIDKIFDFKLEELTKEWYIAKSHKSKDIVLCKESEPNYHNGDTDREFEKPLDDPAMKIIRLACELQRELRKNK